MTTALVLAAGLGRRLRSITDAPKWLVPVGDSSPMRQQLQACIESAVIDDVVAVIGPADDVTEEAVRPFESDISISLVRNADSERWNNWSSALIGFEALHGHDVLLMNSDVFADGRWFHHGFSALTALDGPALSIDDVKPLTDEAMKVAGRPHLRRIGKVGVDDPVGEYVGLAWWPAGTRDGLVTHLRSFRDDPAAAQNWYEHAIDLDMARSRYRGVPVESSAWVEIDDPADVALAEAIELRR